MMMRTRTLGHDDDIDKYSGNDEERKGDDAGDVLLVMMTTMMKTVGMIEMKKVTFIMVN